MKKEKQFGESTYSYLLAKIKHDIVTSYTDDPSDSGYSPTTYSEVQPQSSSNSSFEINIDSDSHYCYKNMYLKLRKEQENTTNAQFGKASYNTPEAIETNEMTESKRPLSSEIVPMIKVKSGHTLMI